MFNTADQLDVFFKPKSVAVLGATEQPGDIGGTILRNLISSPFGGTVYPVTSKRSALHGIRAYPNIAAVPDRVDLAVLVAPAETVTEQIEACAKAGVSGVILISGGFRKPGSTERELEQRVLAAARTGGIRLIGPDCLGVISPVSGLNASFATAMAGRGSVALISQSGAICSALIDWSLQAKVGFSAVVSVGTMLDVGWGALIDYLGSDPHTRSLVIYMEWIGDARSFLSAAREVALDKPILVIKGRRTESAETDAVLDAAFRRVGVLRVDELGDVFHMTEVLARQPRPSGPKLTIITNAGGPGILAADALAGLTSQPAAIIEISGESGPDRYCQALTTAASDHNTDGLLTIMTTRSNNNPVAIAQKIAPFGKDNSKPVLACWMGGEKAREGEAILNRAGIPTFPFPEPAVRAFHYMWRYSYNVQGLYETPTLTEGTSGHATAAAANVIDRVSRKGRVTLAPPETKEVLASYGIDFGPRRDAAPDSYELRLGCYPDLEFGPVLYFGIGGQFAKVFNDQALALPPLNTTLARRFLEHTRIFAALEACERLEQLLVRFSQLVLEQSRIREIEIDPLFMSATDLIALKARIVLHPNTVDASQIPRPAIRPYPSQYADQVALKDGTVLDVRPVRPEDEPMFIRFHSTLSDQSVYHRYFLPMSLESRIRHERLTRMCFIDYDREMALVAEHSGEIAGIARLIKTPGKKEAEVAFLVSDAYQQRGIGSALVQRLIRFGKDEKLELLTACFLAENQAIQRLFVSQGFSVTDSNDPALLEAELRL